jgi:hypothetical protein
LSRFYDNQAFEVKRKEKIKFTLNIFRQKKKASSPEGKLALYEQFVAALGDKL